MKKEIALFFLLVLGFFFFVSCEEEVFPKGELLNKYVLNCILDGHSSFQVAYLSRSYEVEGFDPYENHEDPSVRDAEITLNYEGNIYYFRDTLLTNSTNRYGNNQHFYYLDNFTPEANKPVTITARIPDGTILQSAETTFPRKLRRGNFYRSDSLMPLGSPIKTQLFFKWGDFAESVYFIPKLTIHYSRVIDGVEKYFWVEVPQSIEGNEKRFPVLAIGDNTDYSIKAFDYMFDSIAEEGVDREEYRIHGAKFTLLIPNSSLAIYYSAAKTFSDSYSIHLTEPEYSNIEGGLGVFGSFSKFELPIRIFPHYIEAFGYSNGEDN